VGQVGRISYRSDLPGQPTNATWPSTRPTWPTRRTWHHPTTRPTRPIWPTRP